MSKRRLRDSLDLSAPLARALGHSHAPRRPTLLFITLISFFSLSLSLFRLLHTNARATCARSHTIEVMLSFVCVCLWPPIVIIATERARARFLSRTRRMFAGSHPNWAQYLGATSVSNALDQSRLLDWPSRAVPNKQTHQIVCASFQSSAGGLLTPTGHLLKATRKRVANQRSSSINLNATIALARSLACFVFSSACCLFIQRRQQQQQPKQPIAK